jgi:hypothetical protein
MNGWGVCQRGFWRCGGAKKEDRRWRVSLRRWETTHFARVSGVEGRMQWR